MFMEACESLPSSAPTRYDFLHGKIESFNYFSTFAHTDDSTTPEHINKI